jgi:hypothetical protein
VSFFFNLYQEGEMSDQMRMTELDAINAMLSAIGELPVNTLAEAEVVTLATVAKSVLLRESRNVQSLGLNCNHETNYTLTRNEEGNIQVPSNTLNVDAVNSSEDYVIRGGLLYDKEKHTYIFQSDACVDIVFFLPFNDLPNHVQVYVTALAKRSFQKDYVGSDTLDKMARAEVNEARILFKGMEERNKDATMLANPAVARALYYRNRWR